MLSGCVQDSERCCLLLQSAKKSAEVGKVPLMGRFPGHRDNVLVGF